MDANIIPWIFAIVMTVGVAYLLFNIVFGGLGAGDMDADLSADSPDGEGVGCSAIAAFLAGFGAVGLFGTLAGWHVLVSVAAALGAGVLLGRAVIGVLRFVVRQESTAVITSADLVGSIARVTVHTPAGKTGEALIETEQVLKYPIVNVTDAPLEKGDYVEVVEVTKGRLFVKKKRM